MWRDFYILALGSTLYLLDLRQRSYEKNSPYSSFQYECYYFPGITARVLFQDGDALCFGQADGKLRRFGTNVDDPGQDLHGHQRAACLGGFDRGADLRPEAGALEPGL